MLLISCFGFGSTIEQRPCYFQSRYQTRYTNLIGRFLLEDSDRSKGKKLDVGFTETTRQWENSYGKCYWRAGAMHKGDTPSPVPSAPLPSKNSDCVGEPLFQSNKDYYLTPVKIVEVGFAKP